MKAVNTKLNIQQIVFWMATSAVAAASTEEREHLVSQVLDKVDPKDKKNKDSPLDVIFHEKRTHFSNQDLEADSLEGPSKRRSPEKATPKKHLRDPKMDTKDDLEDPGVLQAYQVSGPAAGLSNGSGASFEDDNTLYFLVDRVKKQEQLVSVDLLPKNGKNSRRAKKRAPQKEEHVEVRTRKAKAENNGDSNEDPPPGIVLGGNGVVWIDGSGKCVQGTSSFVKFTCDTLGLGCCDEEDSCNWPSDQTATVCKNSCTGERACEDIGDGAVIEKDSCKGEKACYDLAQVSTTGKIRVGKNSCSDNQACKYICSQSEYCELNIGDDACKGGRLPCAFMAYEYAGAPNTQVAIVELADGACDGTAACRFVASGGKSISIGKEACVGSSACIDVAAYSMGSDLRIGDFSCDGISACQATAASSLEDVDIGENSCTGDNACRFICGSSEACELTIGDNACDGIRSCYFVGAKPAAPNKQITNVEIKEDACDGTTACRSFGASSHKVKIGKEACQGMDACFGFGARTVQKVEAGDASCDGTSACERFGSSISAEDVKVNKNKCIGDMICSSTDCENTAKVPNKDGVCPA